MLRLGINGFGRIGRAVTRLSLLRDDVQVVAINSRSSVQSHAYLLQYDSVHGKLPNVVISHNSDISVDDRKIACYRENNPGDIPWEKSNVDIVIECSGVFNDKENAVAHLGETVKKVIVSALCSDADKTIVMGVNEHEFNPKNDHVLSNASCTTNCLAPVCKVLEDNFGIVKGMATTVHAATSSQPVMDSSDNKDFRKGRSTLSNIIPTTTGAALALFQVIPSLKNKIDAMAMRVPIANVSVVDLKVELNKNVTKDEMLKSFSNSQMINTGILEVCSDPVVSQDIVGNTASCIVDTEFVGVIGGNFVSILAWYDNEIGYSARLLDLAKYIS